jgi:uncharacterized protein (DUF2141 family)
MGERIMRKLRGIGSSLIFALVPTFALGAELVVQIENIKMQKGNIVADLWGEAGADKFPDVGLMRSANKNGPRGEQPCDWRQGKTIVCRKHAPASGGVATISFPDLPNGWYAVAVFHDADGNWNANPREEDRKPREPYGISNYTGGIPLFGKSRVRVQGRTSIKVRLIDPDLGR